MFPHHHSHLRHRWWCEVLPSSGTCDDEQTSAGVSSGAAHRSFHFHGTGSVCWSQRLAVAVPHLTRRSALEWNYPIKLYDIIELASERSEQDTLSGVTQLKIGDIFLYICLDIHTYVIFVLWPWCFCVTSVVDPVPNFTEQNPLVIDHYPITLEIELFIVLNSFAGEVKTWKPTGIPFIFELVAVVIQCTLCGYKPYTTVFTWKLLSTRLTT